MAGSFINRLNCAFQRLENTFSFIFDRFYRDGFAIALAGTNINKPAASIKPRFSLEEILGNGFLWAVPRNRRTIEKRLKRKFGNPYYIEKIMRPKTNLRTCNVCGDDHEIGVLCPTCYKSVIDETRAMQKAIEDELQLEPVEKEVVVLYDGEKSEKPNEFFEGKRIVEMKRARPSWFSKNLLQETTQQPATTSDVKPSKLG